MHPGIAAVVALLLSIVLWGLLTGRWRRQARSTRRALAQASGAPAVIRVPVPWVFILTYLLGVAVGYLLPLPSPPEGWATPVRLLALAPLALGLWLIVAALNLFRQHSTTTVPFETPRHLVLTGPYRRTRNPMYAGLTATYLGVAGTQLRLWPILLLPGVLLYLDHVVIPLEEEHLKQAFGEDYRAYCGRVRRWV